MEKIDFKNDMKTLYKAPVKGFVFVDVPALKYLMIDGAGDPNTVPAFQVSIETLYSVAFTMKFSAKKAGVGPEYTVAPLSGLWWSEGMAGLDLSSRDMWRWTLMIAQPPFIENEMVRSAVSQLVEKGKQGLWDRIRLDTLDEGLSVQTMHIGPYRDEAPTIAAMHRFILEKGYSPRGRHHEIYLSDPRRTTPERLKTILRHPVSK